jgi:anti-anti-sigma regulatory factor
MKVTQRQVVVSFLGLLIAGSLPIIVILAMAGAEPLTIAAAAGSFVAFSALLWAYRRGWDRARQLTIVIFTLLAGVGMPEPYVSQEAALSILVAPVLALILGNPLYVLGSAGSLMLMLIGRAGWGGVYAEPSTLVAYGLVVGGMILARLVTDTAQHAAEKERARAEEERTRAEQRAEELDTASRRLEEELTRQRALLMLVETLETPVVRLAETVLFAPVVGHLDARRADALMKRLLDAVHGQRVSTMIIDIAGVAMVDTGVAAAIVRTVQGLRMLGCEVVVSGISAPVASSLVQLGVSLGTIRTVRSPQEALSIVAELN